MTTDVTIALSVVLHRQTGEIRGSVRRSRNISFLRCQTDRGLREILRLRFNPLFLGGIIMTNSYHSVMLSERSEVETSHLTNLEIPRLRSTGLIPGCVLSDYLVNKFLLSSLYHPKSYQIPTKVVPKSFQVRVLRNEEKTNPERIWKQDVYRYFTFEGLPRPCRQQAADLPPACRTHSGLRP